MAKLQVIILGLVCLSASATFFFLSMNEEPVLNLARQSAVPWIKQLPIPKDTGWNETKAYQEYVTQRVDKPKNNIAKDPNYCKRFAEFRKTLFVRVDQNGVPLKQFRTVYSDYAPDHLVKAVLSEQARPVFQDHHILRGPSTTEPLPTDLLLHFHKAPVWHRHFEIGQDWLCPGQRYNHIPGHESFSYKDQLLKGLKDYARLYIDRESCFQVWDIVPFTYDLESREDCRLFFEYLNQEQTWLPPKWIVKESQNAHNSDGVQVLNAEQAKNLQFRFNYGLDCGNPKRIKYLAQQYIGDPLLVTQRKFDFRVYMVIAQVEPLLVLYHDGFLRLSPVEYQPENPFAHLTHPDFISSAFANATAEELAHELAEQMWSLERFEAYMIDEGKVQADWLNRYVRPLMKQRMAHLARAFVPKLLPHPGVFELYGVDFMFDTALNLWLFEVVSSPSLHGSSPEKHELMSAMVKDLFEVEFALMFDADIDAVLHQTHFEVVVDARKTGVDRYAGLLPFECL